MSALRIKSLILSPRVGAPLILFGLASLGYAALTSRTAPPIKADSPPMGRVASASLPTAARGPFVRGISSPLILSRMPSEAVTHPFEKNTPPPPPLSDQDPSLRIRHYANPSLESGTPRYKEDRRRSMGSVRQKVGTYMQTTKAYAEPPMSLVSRTKPTALHSRDINRPLCVARAGAKEWIGTPIGVKCVDREREIVRIFAAADGLPLGRVEQIATDDSGDAAVALVRRMDNRTGVTQNYTTDWKPDKVAVCLYDAKTGRWKELGALPLAELKRDNLPFDKANRLSYNYRVSYRVVLTAKQVIVVPTAARTDAETAFAVYDRATGKAKGNAWEDTLRADHSLILVNALARQGDTVIFGTDIGLLLYDTATTTWRRALPTREVSQVVVGDANDAPILALTVPRGSGNGYSSPSDFLLSSVSLRTGNADETRPITLPEHRAGDGTLTIAPDGAIWLTYADYFYKSDPGAAGWTRLDDRGDVVTATQAPSNTHGSGRGFRDDWDPFHLKPVLPVAPEARIPDNAVIARVLMPRDNSPFGRGVESVAGREAMRWMRQRLARWISPPVESEEPLPSPETTRRVDPAWGFVGDPNDPRMMFGLQGKTLLHLPKSEVPGDEPSSVVINGVRGRRYKPLSPTAKNVRKYPLHDAASARVVERVIATTTTLLPDATSDDALYLLTGNGARHYDGVTDTWADLSVPVENFSPGWDHRLFYAGSGTTPILSTQLQPHLMRLNVAAKQFEPVPGVGPDRGNAVSRGGLWEGAWNRLDGGSSSGGAGRAFKYRPLADGGTPTGEWQSFTSEPDLPALRNKSHNASCVVTGNVAWFRYAAGDHGVATGAATIAGYEARTKRWLAPITTPRYEYSTDVYLTETVEGGAVIGIPNAPISVLRYRPATEKWEPLTNGVVPTAKSEDSFRPLLAPDDTVYAVTARELCEYDAARREWSRVALPSSLHNPITHSATLDQLCVAATRKSVYVGDNEHGLWRMDRSRKTWKPVREPVQWSPDDRTGAPYHLAQITADKHAVWAVGRGQRNGVPFLIRWDRRTKTSRFLSESETGLTLNPSGFIRVVSAGDTILLWHNSDPGVYRAAPGGTRFTRVANAPLREAQTAPDNPGIVFLASNASLYQYDERKQRLTMLDPKLPIVQPHGGMINPMSRMLQGGIVATDSAVYVGSIAGAYRYERKTGAWSLVPRTEDLCVQAMRRDGDTLIITTPSTTARFSLR